MSFRKKNNIFTLAALLSLCFFSLLFGFFIKSESAFAVSYFSGTYSARANVYYYDASMPSTRGYSVLTPINNGPVPSTTPSNEGKILAPTGANYYIYAKGITLTGLTISGGDSSKRYQSAEADAYFYMADGPTSGDFDDVDLSCTYYTLNGNSVTVSGDWSFSESIHPTPSYGVILDCPVVNNSNYDPYVSVDFTIGDFLQQNPQSPPTYYFYRYVNGGGVWFSGGSYQVSSGDNEELNAIENQTYIIENGFNNIINTINEHNNLEYESVDNISNQSPSDISDAENQTSSNLINAVAGFTGAVSSISIAPSCTFTLPFPSYAGGDVPVNVCQHKDKAPELVLTFGNITLIAVAVGFWIKCIVTLYRLIRSFIDGIDDGHYIDIEALD